MLRSIFQFSFSALLLISTMAFAQTPPAGPATTKSGVAAQMTELKSRLAVTVSGQERLALIDPFLDNYFALRAAGDPAAAYYPRDFLLKVLDSRRTQCGNSSDECIKPLLNKQNLCTILTHADDPTVENAFWQGVLLAMKDPARTRVVGEGALSCPALSYGRFLVLTKLLAATATAEPADRAGLVSALSFEKWKDVPNADNVRAYFDATGDAIRPYQNSVSNPPWRVAELGPMDSLMVRWSVHPGFNIETWKDLSKWLTQVGETLPHIGHGDLLDQFFDHFPKLVDSRYVDLFFVAENMCYYWRDSQHADKCQHMIERLKSTSSPGDTYSQLRINFEEAWLEHGDRKPAEALKRFRQIRDAAKNPDGSSKMPWIFLAMAIVESHTSDLEGATRDLNQFLRFTKTEKTRWMDFFAPHTRAVISLRERHYKKALAGLDEIAQELPKFIDGPVDLKAWIDLHRTYANLALRDIERAREAYNATIADVAACPSFSYIKVYADAMMNVSADRSRPSDLDAARKILGAGHPDIARYQDFVEQLKKEWAKK